MFLGRGADESIEINITQGKMVEQEIWHGKNEDVINWPTGLINPTYINL